MSASVKRLEELMSIITRIMRREMIGAVRTQDLTMTQLEGLIFIKIQKQVHMNDIAKNFKISMPSATTLVAKLVSMKLVTRKTEENDRRNVTIILTPKGDKLLMEGQKKKSETFKKIMNLISEEDREKLLSVFENLSNKLQTYEEQTKK